MQNLKLFNNLKKIWHGEANVGTIRSLVDNEFFNEKFDAHKAIDDDEKTYFMSKRASIEKPQGLVIEFESPKEIAEILLFTEKDNRHRYKNVCILGDDDFEIACSDRNYDAREKIKFMKEFNKEFFRPVTKHIKIVWDNEYARVPDLKIYYFDPLTDFEDVEEKEFQGGFANEVQYWKDCFTDPVQNENFPFENQGEKENKFEDCALRCVQTPECMVFNWLETDGRCYLRTTWNKSVIGNALVNS